MYPARRFSLPLRAHAYLFKLPYGPGYPYGLGLINILSSVEQREGALPIPLPAYRPPSPTSTSFVLHALAKADLPI